MYKDEQAQDEIDRNSQYEKIIKKIPKHLRIYIKVIKINMILDCDFTIL